MSEEALQIAKERKKAKSKWEKESQLNAKFQRLARRDKKAFLNERHKEIEENNKNNRMGKAKDLFKEIGDPKETFHARMGTIKYRKCKDLIETKEIKKRWQKYT